MVPAQERLKAGDLVPLEIELRLIVELKLARMQCRTQVALELAPRLHPLVHLTLEEARAAGAIASWRG